MAYKALQIAQLLLTKAAEGHQELMSNLKLQKCSITNSLQNMKLVELSHPKMLN